MTKKPAEEQNAAMPTPDPEFQKRAQAFLDEYGELVKKHNVDIAAYPVYMPDGQGAFKTMTQQSTVDTTEQPYRSPFMADENGETKES